MNSPIARCFVTLLAGAAAQGCVAMQMYPGPRLPDEQIATIEPTITYYGFIGDKEVAVISFNSGRIGEPLAVLEVLPGRYLVGLRYNGSTFGIMIKNNNPCYVVVDALAGRQYKVNGQHGIGADRWKCWVSDLDTKSRREGIVVAGELPLREELPALMDAMEAEIARRSAVGLDEADLNWRTIRNVPVAPASGQTAADMPAAPTGSQ